MEDLNKILLAETQSRSTRILDLIASKGDEGMRFSEIQRALWGMSHTRAFTRQDRGWWCTNLLGSYKKEGLLRFFCKKHPITGKWVRNHIPHEGAPWSVISSAKDARMMGRRAF